MLSFIFVTEEEREKEWGREGREGSRVGFVSYLIKSLYGLLVIIITAFTEAMVLFYCAEQLFSKFIYSEYDLCLFHNQLSGFLILDISLLNLIIYEQGKKRKLEINPQ